LGAVVEMERGSSDTGDVDLVYRVQEGTPIELVWQGDDPGSRIREQIEDAWDGRVPQYFLLSELASQVVRELRRERYYQAQVASRVEDTPEGARRVVFEVSRGPRSAGLLIEFEGNEALSDRELRESIPPESSLELYALLFENPSRLAETVERFYASRGYLDAGVSAPVEEGGQDGGPFRVAIPVEEGEPFEVVTIDLEGAESLPASRLSGDLRMSLGEPFLYSDYERDRATISSIYRREGFIDVRVRGDLERADGGLNVVFRIEEGPRSLVGDIRIAGNQATRASLIRRQLTFEKGDPLRLSDLTDTQRRLYQLGIFRSADVRVEPAEPGRDERNVVVEVTEVPDLDLRYGFRYNSEERLEVLTELRAPNLFGGGQQGGLIVQAKQGESLVRLTFHTPYLFSRYDLDTDVFITRETEDTEFFVDRTWSFTFQQTRPLNDWMDLQWSYSLRRIRTLGKVDTGPIPFDFTIYRALLSTSFIEDRRDNLIRPSRGRFWNVTLQGAPDELGADIPFLKLFGQLITFVPLGYDLVWASSYRLGIANAFDARLPADDRFKSGGIDSVRGFAQDSLGRADPITGTAIGGEGLAVFNQELRFPIYRWFRGAAFFDAGNVYLTKSDFDPLDLRYSAGAGIRFSFPFGLLRLDWARAFDRRPGEESSQLWFSFGHAF